jgi:hypothetical protein
MPKALVKFGVSNDRFPDELGIQLRYMNGSSRAYIVVPVIQA